MPGRRVWSANPRHRRSPGLPIAPGDRAHTSLKTGKPVGWLSRKLGLRRTGTTLHGHIEPPNTGGVGPVPQPKPTRPDREPGGPAWPTTGQPVATGTRLAGARNGRERVPEPAGAGSATVKAGPSAGKLPAGPAAAADAVRPAGPPPAKPSPADEAPDRPAYDPERAAARRRYRGEWFGGGVSPTPEDIREENDRIDRQQRDNPPKPPTPPAGNTRRRDLGDSQWGPDPAPPAARDHRPRSDSDGGTTVSASSNPYGRDDGDFTASAARTIHRGGGTGEVQSMRDDMGAFAARHQTEVEAAAAAARRRAAEIRDGTPSSAAVADGWDAHAAQLSAAAQTAGELDALSRSVDADGYTAADRYAGRDNATKWMG
jgi:hypothetical protein